MKQNRNVKQLFCLKTFSPTICHDYTLGICHVCSSHRARIMVLWLSYNFLLCNFGLFTHVSLLISFISHDFYDLTLNKNLLQNKTKHTIWQNLTQNKVRKKILTFYTVDTKKDYHNIFSRTQLNKTKYFRLRRFDEWELRRDLKRELRAILYHRQTDTQTDGRIDRQSDFLSSCRS